MKLTTARLKQLIREEIEKVTEQIDESNPMHQNLFMIIANMAMKQGIKEPTAGAIAKKAVPELLKPNASVYALNTKKRYSVPAEQPKTEEEVAFVIIANVAKEFVPESKAGALGQAAAPEIVKTKAGKISGYALDTKKR